MNTLFEQMPLIPESKRSAVLRAFQTVFGSTSIDGASLLTGGLSSALVYKIEAGDRAYVLRLVLRIDALSDPARQYRCMQLAADAGIAPPVRYADIQDAVSIVDFIDAPPRDPQVPIDGWLSKLAGTVHAIHDLPLFPPLVNFMEGVDGFIQRFQASGLLPEDATREHFRYYAEIQRAYPRHDPDLVSSHNDLNPNNLLYEGGRLWVVDWEAAFRNDRYVDLANIANFFVRSEADEEKYLIAYFGDTLDDNKCARLFLMRQVCRMFYAMIFMHLARTQSSPDIQWNPSMETPPMQEFYTQMRSGEISIGSADGQLLYGKVLLNEMLRDMRTPRFEASIRRMPG